MKLANHIDLKVWILFILVISILLFVPVTLDYLHKAHTVKFSTPYCCPARLKCPGSGSEGYQTLADGLQINTINDFPQSLPPETINIGYYKPTTPGVSEFQLDILYGTPPASDFSSFPTGSTSTGCCNFSLGGGELGVSVYVNGYLDSSPGPITQANGNNIVSLIEHCLNNSDGPFTPYSSDSSTTGVDTGLHSFSYGPKTQTLGIIGYNKSYNPLITQAGLPKVTTNKNNSSIFGNLIPSGSVTFQELSQGGGEYDPYQELLQSQIRWETHCDQSGKQTTNCPCIEPSLTANPNNCEDYYFRPDVNKYFPISGEGPSVFFCENFSSATPQFDHNGLPANNVPSFQINSATPPAGNAQLYPKGALNTRYGSIPPGGFSNQQNCLNSLYQRSLLFCADSGFTPTSAPTNLANNQIYTGNTSDGCVGIQNGNPNFDPVFQSNQPAATKGDGNKLIIGFPNTS